MKERLKRGCIEFFSYKTLIVVLYLLSYLILYLEFVGLSVATPLMIEDESLNLTKEKVGMIIFVSAFGRFSFPKKPAKNKPNNKLFFDRMPIKLIAGVLVESWNPKAAYIVPVFFKHLLVIGFSLSTNFWMLIILWTIQDSGERKKKTFNPLLTKKKKKNLMVKKKVWGTVWPATIKIVSNWFDKYSVATALGFLNLRYFFR